MTYENCVAKIEAYKLSCTPDDEYGDQALLSEINAGYKRLNSSVQKRVRDYLREHIFTPASIRQTEVTYQAGKMGLVIGSVAGYLSSSGAIAAQMAYTLGGGAFGFFAGIKLGFSLSTPTMAQKFAEQPYWNISSYLDLKLESSEETVEHFEKLKNALHGQQGLRHRHQT